MKRKRDSLIFLFSLGLFCSSLYAQSSLYVVKGGSYTTFLLENVRQLVFSASEMTVTKIDASQSVFTYGNIDRLTFEKPTTTKVPRVVTDFYSQVKVYPNPVPEFLNITLDDSRMAVISIISIMSGQTVAQKYAQGEKNVTMNLSGLPRGMYVCKVKQGDKSTSTKIVKE